MYLRRNAPVTQQLSRVYLGLSTDPDTEGYVFNSDNGWLSKYPDPSPPLSSFLSHQISIDTDNEGVIVIDVGDVNAAVFDIDLSNGAVWNSEGWGPAVFSDTGDDVLFLTGLRSLKEHSYSGGSVGALNKAYATATDMEGFRARGPWLLDNVIATVTRNANTRSVLRSFSRSTGSQIGFYDLTDFRSLNSFSMSDVVQSNGNRLFCGVYTEFGSTPRQLFLIELDPVTGAFSSYSNVLTNITEARFGAGGKLFATASNSTNMYCYSVDNAANLSLVNQFTYPANYAFVSKYSDVQGVLFLSLSSSPYILAVNVNDNFGYEYPDPSDLPSGTPASLAIRETSWFSYPQ